MKQKTLRIILGDQLNHKHAWWDDDPETYTVLIAETQSETGYTVHHIQKVVAFFLAMRGFADWLREQRGAEVVYLKLDDPDNAHSISGNVKELLDTKKYDRWEYQLPDEYRLDEELKAFAKKSEIPSSAIDTEHFLSKRDDLKEHFKGKKTYIMESFYRMMRKKYDVLMDGSEPVQNNWNFDAQNRKSLPKDLDIPEPKSFPLDVSEIVNLLEKEKVKTMGRIDPAKFIWPVTRSQSLAMLRFFIDDLIPNFGNYQDAMKEGEWSLFHARLSFAMNSKMIDPKEVIERVEQAWRENKDGIPLAAVEGFIRQILGWREYMRGVYWAEMPDYEHKNFFNHQRKLPEWYWTGDTKMKCLSQAINQSLDYAYAHHIQRLMVTGNFALLAGIDPSDVDDWYLGVYIDALQWVEITNTRGMSQFADGGIVGTKPYVSTANYIDKMSDYCESCHYKKTKKTGEDACPFNALYWDFYERNRSKLEKNPRIGFVYPTLDKMNKNKKEELLKRADFILNNLDSL